MPTGTLVIVNELKESLSKEIPSITTTTTTKKKKNDDDGAAAVDDDEHIDRVKDMLQRLDECPMTLDILTQSLIGTVVSKLKTHEELGPIAKALVKKWKKVVKQQQQGQSSGSTATSSSQSSSKTAASSSSQQGQAKKTEGTIIRRESLNDDVDLVDAAQEWAGLPPGRQNICQKFHALLLLTKPDLVKAGVNAVAVDHLTGPRAVEIEAAVQQHYHRDRSAYTEKARSLAFNLKKNRPLCQNVILGHIQADELVKMSSEQLASAEVLKQRADEAKKLIDSKRLDWEQANEAKINEQCGIKGDLLRASLFTCGRCKSTKTTSTQKQTRSADEPMTVFVFCMNCGKRWKC